MGVIYPFMEIIKKGLRITKNNEDGTSEITHLSINGERWVKEKEHRNEVIHECIEKLKLYSLNEYYIKELEKLKV